jgi:hypothetical protein
MSVTFEEARSIVFLALTPDWRAENGTLSVSAEGFEDDAYWWVVAGPAEWLERHDPDFEQFDVPALLVNKETGELLRLSVIQNLERLGEMTAV